MYCRSVLSLMRYDLLVFIVFMQSSSVLWLVTRLSNYVSAHSIVKWLNVQCNH